jgi:hypothetical protein
MKILIAAALALAPVLAGCASVTEGSTEPVFVTTTPESGATCTCTNDRGSWTVVTPGTVVVSKSESVLAIHCTKPGWKDGTEYASGRISTAGMIGMALPYVGLLNAAVDASTGAATKYPQAFTVQLTPLAPPAPAAVLPPPQNNTAPEHADRRVP